MKFLRNILPLSFLLTLNSCKKNINIENPYVSANNATHYIETKYFSDKGTEIISMAGTAFGVKYIGDKTLFITAGHICNDSLYGPLVSILDYEKKLNLTDINGVIREVAIVNLDIESDLCALLYDGKANIAKMSLDNSIIGEEVYYAGYPLGIYMENYLPHFDGRFSGKDGDEIYIAIPAIQGSSGSALYNEKGEVIGIVIAKTEHFDNLVIGISNKKISEFITDTVNSL